MDKYISIMDEAGPMTPGMAKAFNEAQPSTQHDASTSYRMQILIFGTGGDEEKKKCKSRLEAFTHRFRDIMDKRDAKSIRGNSDSRSK